MNYPIKVKNVCITPSNREYYKYIVVRECEKGSNGIGETCGYNSEYWYYNFTNDLYSATMMIRETGNGIVLELANCIGEEVKD